jgi:hypothetical protein
MSDTSEVAKMLVHENRPMMHVTKLAKIINSSPASAKKYCRAFGIQIFKFSEKNEQIYEDQVPVLMQRAAEQGAAA